MAEELSHVERQVKKRKERRAALEENVEEDPAVQELIDESH